MTSALDKITAHFAGAGLTPVEVPEWGLTLYFRPVTGHDRTNVRRGVDPSDESELIANFVRLLALDENGERVFDDTPKTRAVFNGGCDFNILTRIVAELGERSLGAKVAEAKND
jgi:hypothetical protein